jgi:hypothetical protein
MKSVALCEILEEEVLSEFHKWLKTSEWFSNAPGGFVTNSPKRMVNAYGDGAGVDSNGNFSSPGWPKTYWTAKMSQSNVSLETATEPLPNIIRTIIPKIRELFKEVYTDVKMTDNTFNIAVCNYYSDPDMCICAHTDDNRWYPEEASIGPVFASFTFYPEGEPICDEAFARFQIKQDGKWKSVKLSHNSVMIMPSNIEHRVLPHTKKMKAFFKPRINITLRSTFPLDTNPLMNAMATANHSRYYKIPTAMYIPNDIPDEVISLLESTYNRFASRYHRPVLQINMLSNSIDRKQHKKVVMSKYRSLIKKHKLANVKGGANIVTETLEMVSLYLSEL